MKNVGFSLFCFSLDFEAARLFVLRASSGILAQKHDQKYELSSFYVDLLCFLDFRNYRCWFMLLRHTKKCLFVAMLFFYFFNGTTLLPHRFPDYCARLRHPTALSVLPTQAHRLAVHAGKHPCLSFSCLHLEAFLTPNTAQLTMFTTPNAPVCFSLPPLPQSSTLAYFQAIASLAAPIGNGETRETEKRAR